MFSRLFAAVVATGLSSVHADTLYVDDDNCPGPGDGSQQDPFCTIQAAIDHAIDTDEIIVADGLYTGPGNRDIDFGGRLITLRSANGPENCIIDCEGGFPGESHRGFHFQSGETNDAVLRGLTIRGGYAFSDGGGIRCDDSSPTIVNCVIADNLAFEFFLPCGGGIYSAGGSPVIIDCTINGNTVAGGEFPGYGGGICSEGGNLTIIDSAITGNQAFAIAAYSYGGGVYLNGDGAVLVNCVLTDNKAEIGAGVNNAAGSVTMTNCTVAANGYEQGLRNAGTALVTNCIIWGNNGEAVADISGRATVRNSNVEGGWPGIGNIDADPMFVAASDCCLTMPGTGPGCGDSTCARLVCEVNPSCCDVWWELNCGDLAADLCSICPNDFRLSPGSPCIDAGDNAAVPVGVLRDLDGDPRFAADACAGAGGMAVDMGAYEFQGTSCDLGDVNRPAAARSGRRPGW